MKNIILIISSIIAFSCDKSIVRADNEFYNQSLTEKINGYEIWQKEAQEFSKSSNWAQKITEPLIGYFDIIYYKYQSANSKIETRLNYIFDLNKAYLELEKDALKNNNSINEEEVRAGFYLVSFGGNGNSKIFQTWTIPADAIISNYKKGISTLTLTYRDFTSTTSNIKDANGNIISVTSLNSISNATVILPDDVIIVFSSYGKLGSENKVNQIMRKERKIRDF